MFKKHKTSAGAKKYITTDGVISRTIVGVTALLKTVKVHIYRTNIT